MIMLVRAMATEFLMKAASSELKKVLTEEENRIRPVREAALIAQGIGMTLMELVCTVEERVTSSVPH